MRHDDEGHESLIVMERTVRGEVSFAMPSLDGQASRISERRQRFGTKVKW